MPRKVTYSELVGDGPGKFLSPDELFPSSGLVDFIVEYGQQGLDALDEHPDDQIAQLIDDMIEAGLLEREPDGTLRMTPRMLRGMQHRAFLEIFRNLKPGVRDGHPTTDPGRAGDRTDGTKPYQFGDPLSELALGPTLRNTIQRTVRENPSGNGAPKLPLKFHPDDFELHQVESSTDSALCILIDLSGSMMRYGRHIAAKRVALGMAGMIREKFPLDSVEFIGFASTAERISEPDLPLVMPKPVTTREWEVRVRVPLDQADQTHPHFTNLHHALRLARQQLSRTGAQNKQIFIITDGQPTAHLTTSKAGPGHEILNLIYPPSIDSAEATLEEAFRCSQQGIRISSFALIEEYYGMDWVGFIDQLTRLVRGVAFYCTAGDLGSTIMESYLAGKREKKPLG
ncbi:MAG: VWA domain-containing protein [Phycisphaerales bacterium JB065]